MSAIQRISTGRRIKDRVVQGLVYLAFALAVVPLISVLWLVIQNGLARFDLEFLTHSMRGIGARDAGGGAYHAIIGTLEQVLLASVIAVPIGVLTAIYLVEYGTGGRLSRTISFFVDVMTGVPSIVAGPVHLRLLDPLPRHPVLRVRGRTGAVDPDDADGGALGRGDAQAGPQRPA
ncbi:hypothetical protein [Nonomuraea dietziae]|uniref:hypothetical protein n=1 Tax=Nonomuraea dietziae TaxID=65515 RepID=UPI0031CFBC5A